MAVIDLIESTLIPSFFNPSQPCQARLRIHNESCPTPHVINNIDIEKGGTALNHIEQRFNESKQYFNTQATKNVKFRKQQLKSLRKNIKNNEKALLEALKKT